MDTVAALSILVELINFPYPTICKHSVALMILQGLESNIPPPTFQELAENICKSSAGDDRTDEILRELLQNTKSLSKSNA